MELSHRFTVPIGVEETWAHFNDIASVAECFPGAQVTEADEESFSGSVKVKLGPIALLYNGSGTFVEKDDEAHRFVVDAKGKDKRGNGTAGAKVTVSMAEAGGSTDVSVETDLAITGKPAQFGRGVMQDVSDKLLGQFVACLEQRLAGPAESSDATDSSAGRRVRWWAAASLPRRRSPPRGVLRSHRRPCAAGAARPTEAAAAGARGARPRQRRAPRAREVVLEAGAGRHSSCWCCCGGCCAGRDQKTLSGRNWTDIRGPEWATLGTACSQVRWHDPPITTRSPWPMVSAIDAPPPRGRSSSRRGSPTLTMATMVSAVRPRPIVSPCHATESRPSR